MVNKLRCSSTINRYGITYNLSARMDGNDITFSHRHSGYRECTLHINEFIKEIMPIKSKVETLTSGETITTNYYKD